MAITQKLLARGATIHELNAVRKHLSAIKGGRLAALAYPATVISLILSDVIGDNLDVIGSGPTVPDRSAIADAVEVLRKYRIPAKQVERHFSESPKPGAPEFKNVQNVLVGSNRQSVGAAAEKARELGYHPIVLSTTIDGETRDIARMHAAIAREMIADRARQNTAKATVSDRAHNRARARARSGAEPVCFLSGGETTVTLRGKGMGGRNQEFVLAAMEALSTDINPPTGAGRTTGNLRANTARDTAGNAAQITVFSAGTDGIDGPTDAAGAVADRALLKRAADLGLDARAYLENNDSYRFFDQTGGLVKTGPTGTNVMDIRMILID
jgi:hydroxypyruvate reductase